MIECGDDTAFLSRTNKIASMWANMPELVQVLSRKKERATGNLRQPPKGRTAIYERVTLMCARGQQERLSPNCH